MLLKSLFDNIFLLVGSLVLAITAFLGLTYAFAVYPLAVGVALTILLVALVLKRLEQRINKTSELPKWLKAQNPTLQKLQKQIWSK